MSERRVQEREEGRGKKERDGRRRERKKEKAREIPAGSASKRKRPEPKKSQNMHLLPDRGDVATPLRADRATHAAAVLPGTVGPAARGVEFAP